MVLVVQVLAVAVAELDLQVVQIQLLLQEVLVVLEQLILFQEHQQLTLVVEAEVPMEELAEQVDQAAAVLDRQQLQLLV